MGWSISREELITEITSALESADDAVKEAWERIRIEPEKWQCSPWGDENGGFWVVAEVPHAVVWYNDIEEGFNTSPFTTRGTIGEYRCNQDAFSDFLSSLPEARDADEFAARDAAAAVPAGLAGAGHVVRRQTTYWELQDASGRMVRVHFTNKKEMWFASAEYVRVDLLDAHPLLLSYEQRWGSLYVSQAHQCGSEILAELAIAVEQATHGWRHADEYLAQGGNTISVLRNGNGLLLRAPESIALLAAEIVHRLGAVPSLFLDRAGGPPSPQRLRVLLLGRSFIVAEAFRFVQLG